jgi:peptidoglycan hydrolase-like protein with peptidoglycan-binding domain
MKKSTLLSFVLVSLLSLSFVSAEVTDTIDSSTTCTNLTVNMTFGAKDSTTSGQVSDLQFFLNDKGYLKTDPTGYFGSATLAAVKAFQGDNGITPNGVVGPMTRGAVNAAGCGGGQATQGVSPTSSGASGTAVTGSGTTYTNTGPSISFIFSGTGANGGSISVQGGQTVTGINPASPRTWEWSAPNAASVSASFVVSGAGCSLGSYTNSNWTPWTDGYATGNRFSGSNTRTLGSSYYGCTIAATYTARDTHGGISKAMIKVTFMNKPGSESGNTPIASCSYAPAPEGCTYINGTNYNPTTGCGRVLSCTGTGVVTSSSNPSSTQSSPNNCPTGTTWRAINGSYYCALNSGASCPAGTTIGSVNGYTICRQATTYNGSFVHFTITPASTYVGSTVSMQWSTNNTVSGDSVRIRCKDSTGTTSITPSFMADILDASGAQSVAIGSQEKTGTHQCVAELIHNNVTVKSATTTISVATASTPSGPTGPSPTGLSCYNNNLYLNGTLNQTCPKAPNGGIACDVNLGGCAGEGFVWINGQKTQWKNNTSGYCYANSACELGYSCNQSTSKCEPKKQWSTDFGIPSTELPAGNATGTYFRVWSGATWGNWQFSKCSSGSHLEGSMCVLSTKTCQMSHAPGKMTWNATTNQWGACDYAERDYNNTPVCDAGYTYINSSCTATSRSCTPGNNYPVQYPRGSSVAVGTQTYSSLYGWGTCEVTCKDGYEKRTATTNTNSFTLQPGVTSNAIDYCVPAVIPTTVSGTASISYYSSTQELSSSSDWASCILPSGGSSCSVTLSWTSANSTAADLYQVGVSTPKASGVSGSYVFSNLTPSSQVQFNLTVQPGSVHYTGSVGARCQSGLSWNGSSCATTTIPQTLTDAQATSYLGQFYDELKNAYCINAWGASSLTAFAQSHYSSHGRAEIVAGTRSSAFLSTPYTPVSTNPSCSGGSLPDELSGTQLINYLGQFYSELNQAYCDNAWGAASLLAFAQLHYKNNGKAEIFAGTRSNAFLTTSFTPTSTVGYCAATPSVQPPTQASTPSWVTASDGTCGITSPQTVTGHTYGGVWGGADGYFTLDSDVAAAAVQSGLLQVGQTKAITITPLGQRTLFFGASANGVTSAAYFSSTCAMSLSAQ